MPLSCHAISSATWIIVYKLLPKHVQNPAHMIHTEHQAAKKKKKKGPCLAKRLQLLSQSMNEGSKLLL